MPAVSIDPDDLAPFADIDPDKAQAMIDDGLAMAELVAPCIVKDDFAYANAAKAVIRGAILRWNESGSGAVTQNTAGPFQQSIDTTKPRRSLFWPSEIEQLEKMCARSADETGAWGYDTVQGDVVIHADICSVYFGADYCSCGAVIAGAPLYEGD